MKNLLFVLMFIAMPLKAEVVYTFDDGWKSDITEAFPILAQYGYSGTSYIITSLAGRDPKRMDWGEIHTLAIHGWDIEDHTYSHKDLTSVSLSQARRELDKSIYDLHWHGYKVNHFAAPYGAVNKDVEKLIEKRFLSNRAAWVQNNELNWENNLHPYNLSVLALNEKTDMWLIERCIEHATFEKRLLIFMIHKVVEDPSECKDDYCITRSKLKKVVEYGVNQGTKVVTIDQYFKEHGLEK